MQKKQTLLIKCVIICDWESFLKLCTSEFWRVLILSSSDGFLYYNYETDIYRFTTSATTISKYDIKMVDIFPNFYCHSHCLSRFAVGVPPNPTDLKTKSSKDIANVISFSWGVSKKFTMFSIKHVYVGDIFFKQQCKTDNPTCIPHLMPRLYTEDIPGGWLVQKY